MTVEVDGRVDALESAGVGHFHLHRTEARATVRKKNCESGGLPLAGSIN
jgi:hypothetical protein